MVKHTDYSSRNEFDLVVHSRLVNAGVDIVCLAGFMRVLTGGFVQLWRGRLLNIHPALLPLFKGTHAHRQALDAGVRVTGCTVHFVEVSILYQFVYSSETLAGIYLYQLQSVRDKKTSGTRDGPIP